MHFPEKERVVYEINPLTEVVCQLRYPKILEAEQKLPIDLQRKLSQFYPLFETNEIVSISIQSGGDSGAVVPISKKSQSFEFIDITKKWRVSFNSEFIALTLNKYVRWEEFRERIDFILSALLECYSVKVFTRIGLRYVNHIERDQLELGGVPWRDLLAHAVVGPLSDASLHDNDFVTIQNLWVGRLDQGQVAIRTGIVQNTETLAQAYYIDSDFFSEDAVQAGAANVFAYLDTAHTQSGRVFRWCISDRLHGALKPSTP